MPAAVQGALYMTGAAVCFAVMNLLIRLAAVELSALQIAFFRNFFAFVFMLPWAFRLGARSLKTLRLGTHFVRSVVGLAGMLCWFTSVALLPLADAVALNFTAPLFVTIGAALFLGETVRARRWTATAIGFVGTLVILRPGLGTVSLISLLPIIAAGFMAVSTLVVKSLSRTESPGTVVLYMNLFMTPISLIPALWVWRWPSGYVLALMVALGLVAAVAHILLTRAYVKADASAVQPFDYTRLPFVALLGYVFFAEVPDQWLWLGATLIIAAAIYIAHREAVLAKQARRETSK